MRLIIPANSRLNGGFAVRKWMIVPAMALMMGAGAAVPQWHVQPASPGIGFVATGGGYKTEGRFPRYVARIRFDPANLEASSAIVAIDLNSVSTGQKGVDDTLRGADWFATGTAPQAVFTARRFEKASEGSYVAHGTLKMKGVTAAVALPFTLSITNKQANATGKLTLDRTVWGIGVTDKMANDQVDKPVIVNINLKATSA